jgi:hypothetical protein
MHAMNDGTYSSLNSDDELPSRMSVSRTGLAVSAAPSILMLALFYSLAFHMYQSLGTWPNSIGESGFSSALVRHANLTMYVYIGLFLFTIFGLPVAILVSLVRPRWRHLTRYLTAYALGFALCWAIMQLAPDPFLCWWRD